MNNYQMKTNISSVCHQQMISFCQQRWAAYLQDFKTQSNSKIATFSDLLRNDRPVAVGTKNKNDYNHSHSKTTLHQQNYYNTNYSNQRHSTSQMKQASPPYQNHQQHGGGVGGGSSNSYYNNNTRSGTKKNSSNSMSLLKDNRMSHTGRASPSPSPSPSMIKGRVKNFSVGSRHNSQDQGDSPSMSSSYFTPGSTASLSQTPPSLHSPEMHQSTSTSSGFLTTH